MKKFLSLLLLVAGLQPLMAQDMICKRNQTTIEAKVLEISTTEVLYKRFSNPDGPTYRLPLSEVLHITYPNGEQDIFAEEQPATAPQPSIAAPADEPTPATPTEQPIRERLWEVGEYYESEGVRGLVIATSEGGKHGLILSLEQVADRWDTFEKGDNRLVGASATDDGDKNMAAVARYIAEHDLSWDHFPAFKWCRDLGEGWYLPAIDEWLTISFNFNGGSRTEYDRATRNRINSALKEHGGKRLDKMLYYYSSTELDERMAQTGHMEMEPPYVVPLKKNGITYLVRAVRKF